MARPDSHFAAPECLSLTTGWSAPFTSRRGRPPPEGQDVSFHEEMAHDETTGNKTRTSNFGLYQSKMTTTVNQPGPWSDMFSLGLIICAVYKAGEPAQASYERQQAKRYCEVPTGHMSSSDDLESMPNVLNENLVEFNADASRVEQLSVDCNVSCQLLVRV